MCKAVCSFRAFCCCILGGSGGGLGSCSISKVKECAKTLMFSLARLISFHTGNIVSKQNQFVKKNILKRATGPHVFVVFI